MGAAGSHEVTTRSSRPSLSKSSMNGLRAQGENAAGFAAAGYTVLVLRLSHRRHPLQEDDGRQLPPALVGRFLGDGPGPGQDLGCPPILPLVQVKGGYEGEPARLLI